MPSDAVRAITQDHRGFIWAGTTNGLVRLDGAHLLTIQTKDSLRFDLPHNFINDLFFDSLSHLLYIATSSGLAVLDAKTLKMQSYREGPLPGDLPFEDVILIRQDGRKRLWVGLNKRGIARFDPQTKKFEALQTKSPDPTVDSLLQMTFIFDIYPDPRQPDRLWLATERGLMSLDVDKKEVQRFVYSGGAELENLNINQPRTIFATAESVIYGTWQAGYYRLDIQSQRIERLPLFDDAKKRVGRSFLAREDGTFWINTNFGSLLYDPEQGRIRERYDNVPAFEQFYTVDFIDRDQRIWTITNDYGLYCYPPVIQQFNRYYYQLGPRNYRPITRAYLEDTIRAKSYFGAQFGDGLYVYDSRRHRMDILARKDQAGEGSLSINGLLQLQDGQILIATDTLLFTLDATEQHVVPFRFQIPTKRAAFRHMVQDDDGWIWVSSRYEGVFRLNPQSGEVQQLKSELEIPEEPRNYYGMKALMKDRHGNIWMETWVGFSIWEAATGEIRNFALYKAPGKLNYGALGNFFEDASGRVWIAAQSLLYMDSISQEAPTRLNHQWRNDIIHQVILQPNGRLWLFGDLGLEAYDPTTESTRFFNNEYFAPFQANAIQPISNNRILIMDRPFFSFFYPDQLYANEEEAVPYLTAFKIFDDPLTTDSVLYDLERINLSYKQNFFTLEFSAIQFNMPGSVRFQYRLEGFDKDWIDAADRRYVSYTNVPGGTYNFELRAFNNEGIVNSRPFRMQIYISTPFWKSTLFYVLLGLGIYGLSWWVYRLRIRTIKKRETLKRNFELKLAEVEMSALRAQMNPHFIFNSLNSIDYYIVQNKSAKASDYLNRFSRLIRLILQNSRSKYVSLKDELEALKLYIEIESLRFNNRFDYRVQMEKGLNAISLEVPPMIIQPYVENAIWHGLMQKKGRGLLELTITRQDDKLQFVIEDNGIGREAAQQLKSKTSTRRKSFGMKITSDRLDIINRLYHTKADVQVTDLKHSDGTAKGTRVEITIPI